MEALPQEIEPGLLGSLDKSILWGSDSRPGDYAHRDEIDATTEELRRRIRDDSRSDLERMYASLVGSLRTRRHVVPFFVQGNGASDLTTQRNLNSFPDLGQWVLESIVGWADPAASANLQANVTLDQALPIPVPVLCSKTGAAPILLGGIPVMQQDTVKVATSGGVAADRGAVLLIFKREG